jgi:hypothetical protein
MNIENAFKITITITAWHGMAWHGMAWHGGALRLFVLKNIAQLWHLSSMQNDIIAAVVMNNYSCAAYQNSSRPRWCCQLCAMGP